MSERLSKGEALTRVAVGLGTLLIGGCASLGYYPQAVWGGLKLLAGRRAVDAVLGDPESVPELKDRLREAVEIRDFASRELGLPDNKSYRTYKEIDRPFASWTVVAAPELSLRPVTWCFPVAGCVSYRAYFSPQRAERFAERLRAKGFDVEVGGVRAYSTLGWFADPLLSSFVELPRVELAALLIHELAHQRLWVKGDTVFNESFATAVELEGVRRWLEIGGDAQLRGRFAVAKRREWQFVRLVSAYRERLAAAYEAARSEEWKRRQKRHLLDELRRDYHRSELSHGEREYDAWFGEGLNNARLASVATYHHHLPAFCVLLRDCEGSLECFYHGSEGLARLSSAARTARLAELASDGEAACKELLSSLDR